jgi:hypothetical protein
MKKNIIQFNNKEQRHGYWEYYYDGKLVGYEESYLLDGKLTIKRYHL